MENLNTKILNKGEKKMSNKTQVWVNDWIETETETETETNLSASN